MSPLGVDAESERWCRQIGARVEELRREKGWSQQQLADVLNNTPQWVSLVETGKQNLRIHTLVRLARALKVPMPSLLNPPEVPPPTKTRGRPRKDQ